MKSILKDICNNFSQNNIYGRILKQDAALYKHLHKSRTYSNKAKHTHFGYKTVHEDEKSQKVHTVFEQVAKSYDLMNDAMSLGIHRIWKDIFIERLSPMHGTKLLDVAGGTGDISFRFLKYIQNNLQENFNNKKSEVTVLDINQAMLDVGKARYDKMSKSDLVEVNWICGDAEKLPFEDNIFSAYTVAFGIRNVTHIDQALKEAFRVLKPGGRFLCLEFSHLNSNVLQQIYDKYSFEVIPPMGQILAGQWEAYQYLVESIRKFPSQEQFLQMIKEAGFCEATYENLSLGICSIHSGFKLE